MEKIQKVVLITGCSSGFGLLMSIAFAKEGYKVIATMRNLTKQQDLINKATEENVLDNIDILPLDVLSYKDNKNQLKAILNQYPVIDIYINNAGVILSGMLEDLDIDLIENQLNINITGSIWITQAIVKQMIKQKHGKIIFMSSLAGRRALPMQSAYQMSKFAIEGFAESLYFELAPYNIDISLIEPGVYNTNIWKNAILIKDKHPNNYKQKFYKISEKFQSGDNPEIVVNKVLKIVNKRNPRLRYILDRKQNMFIKFKQILYSPVFKKLYCRYFSK